MYKSVNRRHSHNFTAIIAALGAVLLLAACSPRDNAAPTVHITSASTSSTADYTLTGIVFDNVGVTQAAFALGAAAPQNLTLVNGAFSVGLTLAAGDNTITVSAGDAAGNQVTISLTVDYQAAPSGAVTTVDIADRGDSIVITGSNFGAGGSADVGGAAAIINAWSDDQVELTIPMNAPGGPQQVSLHGAYGTSSFELFIGVDFPLGNLDDLVALGLARGTAVRLEAGTYGAVGPGLLVFDNLSLHGAGADDTLLDFDAAVIPVFLGNSGYHLVVADLGFTAPGIFIGPGPVDPIPPALDTAASAGEILAAAAATSFASAAASSAELAETVAAWYASSGDDLTGQTAGNGSLTFRDGRFLETAGGSLIFAANPFTGYAFAGELVFDGFAFVAPDSAISLMTPGNITFADSSLLAAEYALIAVMGSLALHGSELENTAPLTSAMIVALNLEMVDSHVSGGLLDIAVLPMLFPALGGSALIEESSFVASNGMSLGFAGVSAIVRNSEFESVFDLNVIVEEASVAFRNNGFSLGETAFWSQLYVDADGSSGNYVEFTGNVMDWHTEGNFWFHGNHVLLFNDNILNGHANASTAFGFGQATGSLPLDVTAAGNTFTGFENALYIQSTLGATAEFSASINGNTFDFPISASPQVARLWEVMAANAALDASNNVWGNLTDAAEVASYIDYAGGSDAVLFVDPVATP